MNEEKRQNILIIQKSAINKTLNEQEANKKLMDFAYKLKMEAPSNTKDELINVVKNLNDKFNLSISLDLNNTKR